MFNFGILSTHLPYIILFAVYIYTLSVSFQKGEPLVAINQDNPIVSYGNDLAFSAYSQAGDQETHGNDDLITNRPSLPDGIYISGPPTCFRTPQEAVISSYRSETNSSRAPPAICL